MKITIKEIESPNLLIEAGNNRYELLCEFQDKVGTFQRAYVQENGNDVIIELGKDRAIAGLFSVEDGKVKDLFEYIEASTSKADGFVCWLAGEFERLLEQASKDGRKYPLIQNSIGLNDKLPLFYRQRALDLISVKAIEEHTVTVDFVEVSSIEKHEEQPSAEEYEAPPKVTQAGMLPEGWKWVDYDDGSGHLESPNGKKYFDYDRQPYYASGNIEYRETETDRWGPFFDFDEVGSFDDFKQTAEKIILEHVLENVGGLMNMDKLEFYVIDDMKKAFDCVYFDDVPAALERFQEALHESGTMPALGVRVADGAMDLLHGVCGEAVLVPDYRNTASHSEDMKAVEADIRKAVRWLIEEKWCVKYEYQNSIMPVWGRGDVKVLVPATLGNEPKNSYCNDKVLKTSLSSGIDAIDSLYIENHGWVAYNELLRNSKEYAPEGFIKVQQLNVVYVREKNVVGIDGRMDVAPHDFAEMVSKINKPYSLVAYDKQEYRLQYKDKHEFIIASFNNAQAALEGLNEVRERTGDIPLIVQSRDSGHVISSFNGVKNQAQVENLIADAKARTNDPIVSKGEKEAYDFR